MEDSNVNHSPGPGTEEAFQILFPGIAFRDTAAGFEAYVLGHRVAVWEVVDVYQEAKSVFDIAEHFGWPENLVNSALAYASYFPDEISAQRQFEIEE